MFHVTWKVSSYDKSIQQFGKTTNCVRDTVNSKGCWTVLVSSRADRTNCKFSIQHQKVENKETVNTTRLTEKRTADSVKRHWNKSIHNSLTIFKKKLLLSGTQITIATMLSKLPHSPSVSVPLTPVLSSAYHPSSTTHALSFTPPFKISLISTSDQSLYLLWDVIDCCPHISVEEQDSSVDQIKNAWHISNESQLQSYTQQESQQFLQMLNNLQWEQDTDVQHAQKLHNHLNEAYEQNNVAEANLQVL